MEHYDENKESSYVQYYDDNSSYAWAMTQKLPVGDFKFKKNIQNFTEDFIKSYDEDSYKGYIFLK